MSDFINTPPRGIPRGGLAIAPRPAGDAIASARPGQLVYNTPGTYAITLTEGMIPILVECWGAGGNGVDYNVTGPVLGGGGGGAGYANAVLSATPGDVLNLVVKSHSTGGASAANLNGGSSLVAANSGFAGTGATGGSGGTGATGDVKFTGGVGASSGGGAGGGGGGSADSTGAGNAGSSFTGGAAIGQGGAGGNGGNGSTNATAPTAPGGGGGGGILGHTTASVGADGKIVITWPAPT